MEIAFIGVVLAIGALCFLLLYCVARSPFDSVVSSVLGVFAFAAVPGFWFVRPACDLE